jgi:hypothetical protein
MTRLSEGVDRLRSWRARADRHDVEEGMVAYFRYNAVMRSFASMYDVPLDRVCAAFCSLSPNSDYVSNLRSLASILEGLREGRSLADVQVATYRHCAARAWAYVNGWCDFLADTKGPKVRAFYLNIMDPTNTVPVTVDGHIAAMWRGKDTATMRDAIVRNQKEYDDISWAIRTNALQEFILPNQYQATLWFTRKRVLRIKAELQFDMFLPTDDLWKTNRPAEMVRPYPRRRSENELS